jgi:hypothetical protein
LLTTNTTVHHAFLTPRDIRQAQQAFSTRRVPVEAMRILLTERTQRPVAGQLVLARVVSIGQHTRVELANGRRAQLYVGENVILAYGNRYAPDQFEGVVPPDLGPCQLIAAGGLAGLVVARHESMDEPTQIEPLGLIADERGVPLNLSDFALPILSSPVPRPPVLMVCGTSMNSGKTHAASYLVRGLTRLGYRVGALKVTGTGAGGDLWRMADAGAVATLDFTDAGHASTYRAPLEGLRAIPGCLLAALAQQSVDAVVMEVADGLVQQETAALLADGAFRECVDGTVFCAGDALGAAAGATHLERLGYRLLAVSGTLTRSPLAVREASALLRVPVLGPLEIEIPDCIAPLLPWQSQTDPRAGGSGDDLSMAKLARSAFAG